MSCAAPVPMATRVAVCPQYRRGFKSSWRQDSEIECVRPQRSWRLGLDIVHGSLGCGPCVISYGPFGSIDE